MQMAVKKRVTIELRHDPAIDIQIEVSESYLGAMEATGATSLTDVTDQVPTIT